MERPHGMSSQWTQHLGLCSFLASACDFSHQLGLSSCQQIFLRWLPSCLRCPLPCCQGDLFVLFVTFLGPRATLGMAACRASVSSLQVERPMPSVSFQIPLGPQAQSGCLLLSLVLSKWMVLRNIIFPAVSVNKDVTVISDDGPPMWAGESWGNTEGKECLPSSSHQTAATPSGEPQGSSGCEKHRILAPDSWDAYQRNNFSELRLLHLPIYRKALNSFTWDVWFSLISNNLSMFRLPVLCCKTSI